jgi:hypothetical protein
MGLVVLFPLAIVSNALVPTEHMPSVLRTIADWDPVSAVTSTSVAGATGVGAGLYTSRGRDPGSVLVPQPGVGRLLDHER